MKNIWKGLLLGLLALALCGMVITASANAVSFTLVEVLSGESDTVLRTYQPADIAAGNVTLSTAERLRVTVTLTDGAATPAAVVGECVTFLSNKADVDLTEATIQYVDQIETGAGGVAVITFRPRASIAAPSSNVAKSGGVDVAMPATFNYAVTVPLKTMTFSASATTITAGNNATFTLHGPDSETISGITVKDNGTALDASAYTYTGTTLTISGLAAGSHPITVEASGYETPDAVAITVEALPSEAIPEEKVEEAVNAVNSAMDNHQSLAASVVVGDETLPVSYTVMPGAKATLVGNSVTLNNGVFAAKVTVQAQVGTNVTVDKTYYVIPANTQVAFGNLELISGDDGQDAFTTAERVATAHTQYANEILAAKATALNIALGRQAEPFAGVMNFDGDDDVELAEYYIFKQMLAGVAGFSPEEIAAAQAQQAGN